MQHETQVKFVKAVVMKGAMTIKLLSEMNTIIDTFEVDVNDIPIPVDCFYALATAVADHAERGEKYVFITANPYAASLVNLESASETDQKWKHVYDQAVVKNLSFGFMRPGENQYMPPVAYGLSISGEELKKRFASLKMDELKLEIGQLTNDGKLIVESIDLYKKSRRKVIFQVIIIPSMSLGDLSPKDNTKVLLIPRDVGVGDSRLNRIFNYANDPRLKITELVDMKGRKIKVEDHVEVFRLQDKVTGEMDPLVLFQGSEMPMDSVPEDSVEWVRWRKSVWITQNGFNYAGNHYSFFIVSSAGQRTITAMYMKDNVVVPPEELAKLPENYRNGEFSKLSEKEKFYDLLSYGGYLKMRGTMGVSSKVLSRLGLVLSTSISLGEIKGRTIGRIYLDWQESIGDMYRAIWESYGWDESRIQMNLAKLRKHWKPDVFDGSNFIRASWAAKALKEAGVRKENGTWWTEQELVGVCIQYRYVSQKGLAIVLPDHIFDSINFAIDDKVIYPFRGYDLIAEANSVKYEWNPAVFTGTLAPVFEMVGISKQRGSSYIDAQLVNCMQFKDKEDPQVLKNRIAKNFTSMAMEIADINVARVANGVYGNALFGDEIISPYGADRSFLEKFLKNVNQKEGAITEPYVVNSIIQSYMGIKKRSYYGKFQIDGERWFIVPEVSVLWNGTYVMTGKTDFLSGEEMFDIMIEDPSQTCLPKPNQVWACGKLGKLASYRNPLNCPGEVVFSDGVSLGEMDDSWAQEVYGNMMSTLVLSPFSATANLMGGGDFDGDRAMVIWDEAILSLLYPDDLVLVDVDTSSNKIEINYENLRDAMANSLCNAGIGLITNWGTTWAEIAHVFKWYMVTQPERIKLPEVYRENRNNPEEGEFWMQKLSATFFKEGKQKKYDGAVIKAMAKLTLYGNEMPAWEKQAVEAMAKMRTVQNSLEKSSIPLAEFMRIAPIVLEACEGATKVVRYLQELAINTAKSDKWALYVRDPETGELQASSRYDYISLFIRPYWRRAPARKNTFESNVTPMGVVSSYTEATYAAQHTRLMSGTHPIPELTHVDKTSPIYREVDSYVLAYNNEVRMAVAAANALGGHRDRMFDEIKFIKSKYRSIMQNAMYQHDIIDVLMCAYASTHTHAVKDDGRRMSFVYATMGEELGAWLNNSALESDQSIAIPINLARDTEAEFVDGRYYAEYDQVLHRTIISDNNANIIGLCPCKPDSTNMIDVFFYEGRGYAKLYMARSEEKLSNPEFGQTISILGLQAHGMDEHKLMNVMRAKVGSAFEKQSVKLGERQDFVRFAKTTRTDSHGVEIPCIAAVYNGEVIGHVATSNVDYVERMMRYGSVMVVELSHTGKQWSEASAKVKVIDAIVE